MKLCEDLLSTSRVTSCAPIQLTTHMVDGFWGVPNMVLRYNSTSSLSIWYATHSCTMSLLDSSSLPSFSLFESSSKNTCHDFHLCSLLHLSPHLKHKHFFYFFSTFFSRKLCELLRPFFSGTSNDLDTLPRSSICEGFKNLLSMLFLFQHLSTL